MRKFDEPELDEMLALMNEIRRTGLAPSDWSTIRCLLHFKKGDEYHVKNYRGRRAVFGEAAVADHV